MCIFKLATCFIAIAFMVRALGTSQNRFLCFNYERNTIKQAFYIEVSKLNNSNPIISIDNITFTFSPQTKSQLFHTPLQLTQWEREKFDLYIYVSWIYNLRFKLLAFKSLPKIPTLGSNIIRCEGDSIATSDLKGKRLIL